MTFDWQRLQQQLEAEHFARPQNVARITRAIGHVREGLDELARLGHPFCLIPGIEPTTDPDDLWPQTWFHMDTAPNGRIVRDRWQLETLGDGWCKTLAEAQHMAGKSAQFAGRGGIRSRNLPAVIKPVT